MVISFPTFWGCFFDTCSWQTKRREDLGSGGLRVFCKSDFFLENKKGMWDLGSGGGYDVLSLSSAPGVPNTLSY